MSRVWPGRGLASDADRAVGDETGDGSVHGRVWDAVVSDSPLETLNLFHAPARWSPHITFGRTRRAGAFADRQIPGLLPAPPLSARLVTLRSYDTETGVLEVLEPRP
ncbi:hypothetical protein [Streptomyces triticiradicis]|uniref:hypothetical protein n=1 Tax=Streptomyces triticiradicis TaxID=2651189 RepID=UPI001CED6F97|nr:hypothetical protein [Streptomyces triticiradicis]